MEGVWPRIGIWAIVYVFMCIIIIVETSTLGGQSFSREVVIFDASLSIIFFRRLVISILMECRSFVYRPKDIYYIQYWSFISMVP